MTRGRLVCTAACAMPITAVSAARMSRIPVSQPGGLPSSANVRHRP